VCSSGANPDYGRVTGIIFPPLCRVAPARGRVIVLHSTVREVEPMTCFETDRQRPGTQSRLRGETVDLDCAIRASRGLPRRCHCL
jgi:hypothetical protein